MRRGDEREWGPIVWLVGVALTMLAAVAGCVLLVTSAGLGLVVDVVGVAGLEQATDLQFPPGTTLVAGKRRMAREPSVEAIVHMARDEVEAFLRQPPFSGEVTSSDRLLTNDADGVDEQEIAGWEPESAREFLAARGEEDFVWVVALADLDDPTTAVVYLVWWVS